MNKSINEDALRLPNYLNDSPWLETVKRSKLFDNDKKLKDFSQKELNDLYHSKLVKTDLGNGVHLNFEGVVDRFVRNYIKNDIKTMSERTQKSVGPFITMGPCELCHGARLSQKALACKIQ